MPAKFILKTDREQYEKIRKTIRASGALRGFAELTPKEVVKRIQPYRKKTSRKLACLNPWASERFKLLFEGLDIVNAKPEIPPVTITIIPECGLIDLSVSRTSDELHHAFIQAGTKTRQKCRNLLLGVADFLLFMDTSNEVVNNKEVSLSIHVHGFAWGHRSAIQGRLDKLPDVGANTRGGRIGDLDSDLGWIKYATKDPRLKSIRNQGPDQSWIMPPMHEQLTKNDQLRLIDAYDDLTIPEMAFASEEDAPF